MERLTTDSPKTNFSAMMNFAYAKNGETYLSYADGEKDVNLAEYIATVAREHGCSEITNTDVLDGACLECDCPIAVLNVAAIQAAELRARLEQYEDAEAEGRLVMLPCKIGDTVHQILRTKDGRRYIRLAKVGALHLGDTNRNRRFRKENNYIVLKVDDMFCAHVNTKEIGKTVFLTKEEAEQALKGECK